MNPRTVIMTRELIDDILNYPQNYENVQELILGYDNEYYEMFYEKYKKITKAFSNIKRVIILNQTGALVALSILDYVDTICFDCDECLSSYAITRLAARTSSFEATKDSYYYAYDGVLYSKYKSVLIAYPSKKCGDFVVPEGTEEIAEHAFNEISMISSITLSNSVNKINIESFSNFSLKEFNFGNNIDDIPSGAFYNVNINNLTISPSIKIIKTRAFMMCRNLHNVVIQDGCIKIEEDAFYCSHIGDLHIPQSIEYVCDKSFLNVDCIYLKKIPENLINAVSTKAPKSAIFQRENIHTVPVCINDKRYFLPRMINPNEYCNIKDDVESSMEDIIQAGCYLYTRIDIAVQNYCENKSQAAKKYIESTSSLVLKKLLKFGEIKRLHFILNGDVEFEYDVLIDALRAYQDELTPDMTALFLNAINKSKKPESAKFNL